MTDTTNLALTLLAASPSQPEVTVNNDFWRIDAICQLSVKDRNLTAPPAAGTGDIYIPAATATGGWAGYENYIAHYHDGAWYFYAPSEGWIARIEDENINLQYDGAAWSTIPVGDGETYAKESEITKPTSTIPTSTSGVLVLDYAVSSVFDVTLTENITTLTLSNPLASSSLTKMLFMIEQGGTGSYTVAWPVSVKWASATAPTLSTAVGNVDIVEMFTIDNGTTWHASVYSLLSS